MLIKKYEIVHIISYNYCKKSLKTPGGMISIIHMCIVFTHLLLGSSPGTLDVCDDVSRDSWPRLRDERSLFARLATACALRGVGKVRPTTSDGLLDSLVDDITTPDASKITSILIQY